MDDKDPLTDQTTDPGTGLGGSNLSHVRAHNERLVLSLIRTETLSRAEIARRTGLSPQTITLITRSLSSEGLIESGEPVRGKVGQPSVPLKLNPNGAYFLGVKVGRRSTEMILINFMGEILQHRLEYYAYPTPSCIMQFLSREIPDITQSLAREDIHRLHGLGIAMPYQLWSWSDTIDAPAAALDPWREFSFSDALAEITDLPIFIENDVTSACGAELTFGEGHLYPHYGYFFIGYFIGGALVINGSVHAGHTGNAGAFGSLPVMDEHAPGRLVQLIDAASVHLLESNRECSDLLDGDYLDYNSPFWSSGAAVIDAWTRRTANALATAITSVSSVTDVGAIIIDGGFPAHVRERIVEQTIDALQRSDTKGINLPLIRAGVIGPEARALGAARLPLFSRFLLDQSVLTNTRG
ncbi:ROK family transcriptional regulator [Granulosicoccus sp. 3-233]|uniref:ROK family transcriptional regulator n=1 Tax=Granulosicoccus sp. 3-233 TaxID=3417969 RepID=UPI003D3546E5